MDFRQTQMKTKIKQCYLQRTKISQKIKAILHLLEPSHICCDINLTKFHNKKKKNVFLKNKKFALI